VKHGQSSGHAEYGQAVQKGMDEGDWQHVGFCQKRSSYIYIERARGRVLHFIQRHRVKWKEYVQRMKYEKEGRHYRSVHEKGVA
jgi:hypothetical protein